MPHLSHRSKPPLYRATALLSFLLCAGSLGAAQTARTPSTEVEKRVEAILSGMTLEEKLRIFGGINDFYIQAIPRLGLPALRMSDGPRGVHDYGPTSAYPAGILLAEPGDFAILVGSSSAKIELQGNFTLK